MTESAVQLRVAMFSELWIHTGTACNLECPFCLEGSKPGDTRLAKLSLSELKPYLESAVQLGAQRFAFTGGEPLIVKEIVKILEFALQLKPCMVFTNGTAPLIKRVHQLALLQQQPHPLEFRVSLDQPNEHEHDAERGWGNFKRALDGLKLLHGRGFAISIARHSQPDEDSAQIDSRYRELLRKHRLPEATPIVALPDFGRFNPDSDQARNTTEHNSSMVTAAQWLEAQTAGAAPMCTRTRMLVKTGDSARLWACPLTDDDPRFDTGSNLVTSLATPIELRHDRCQHCIRGASY
jgi:sulfatase maturation enzyme AslB (radical SAM superfamily)